LSAQLASIVKEVIRSCDTVMRDIADLRSRNQEQMKSDLKLKMRSLDQRDKLMQSLAPRVAKLAQACTDVETAATKALSESAKAAKVGIA
jgi:hypothetical protein